MEPELMELTLDSIADGIIATNQNGLITGINLAALEMTGVTYECAMGQPIDNIFRLVDRRSGNPVIGLWQEALACEKKVSLFRDVMLVNSNGERSFLSAKFSPIRNEGVPPEGVVVVFRDVTQLRQDEEKLGLYLMALEQSPNAVIVTNAENRIVYVNKQFTEMTEYSQEEALGNDPRFLKSGSTPRKTYDKMWETVKSGQVWHGDLYNRKKNGQFYWEKASISPIINALGHTTHFLAIKEDVTLQKAMEEELYRTREMSEKNLRQSQYYMKQLEKARRDAEAANRAKSEFLATMSHEIRTPLNGMLGMISLTEMTPLSPEQKENLEIIRICGDNLLNVINNILDFSKIESGKMELERTVFNFSKWLAQTMKIHQGQAGHKGILLKWWIDPQIPDWLAGDSKQLQQVLNNIIGNAVKFTEKGWINVTIKLVKKIQKQVWLDIKVTDTGIGIPQQEIPRLFDSFTQLDGSISHRFGGTGLGLNISRKLMELMGGTIEATSVQGKGSTFTISLPMDWATAEEQPQEMKKRISVESALPELGKRILLAEDDEINCVVIQSILKGKGYAIECARNGLEAVDLWESYLPDLILMDIQMPGIDGIEATRRIRQKEKGSGQYTPIVALTAHAIYGDRERFINAGMDEYVAKPIEFEKLNHVLEKVLNPQFQPLTAGMMTQQQIQQKAETPLTAVNFMEDATQRFIPDMFQLMDELAAAIDAVDHKIIEQQAQRIKQLAIQADELDIKNRSFKLQLASRKKDTLAAIQAYASLKRSFETYIAFAGQLSELEQKGGNNE